MDAIFLRIRRRSVLQRYRLVKIRRNLRDVSDPFEANIYVSKHICKILIQLIKPHMKQRTRLHGLNSTLRILCALRFLAVGCYQRPIGQDFFVAMSQTSVSRCLDEVCAIIEDKLAKQYVQFRLDTEDNVQMKEQFYDLYRFPGVIGLVDGTPIFIKKPCNSVEHVYYASRKAAHTKNVQIICDANLMILNVNARYGGSAHDSFVWNNSIIKAKMMTNYENGGRNTYLLGDSGYAQQPWLMTPFATTTNQHEEAYNVSHKKTRHIVERCIGVLKSRFCCLSRQRILMYSPKKAGLIINCCTILHNIMILHGVPLPPEEDIEAEMDSISEMAEVAESVVDPARILSVGRAIRDGLANTFI